MIAAVLAAAALQGHNIPVVPGQRIEVTAYAEASLLLAAPPCGTPEAARAEKCIRWVARPDDPRAIGYQRPLLPVCSTLAECGPAVLAPRR